MFLRPLFIFELSAKCIFYIVNFITENFDYVKTIYSVRLILLHIRFRRTFNAFLLLFCDKIHGTSESVGFALFHFHKRRYALVVCDHVDFAELAGIVSAQNFNAVFL